MAVRSKEICCVSIWARAGWPYGSTSSTYVCSRYDLHGKRNKTIKRIKRIQICPTQATSSLHIHKKEKKNAKKKAISLAEQSS